MSSDAQQNKGYLLPTPITGWDLICVTLKIPDAPEYRAAFRGQLKGLTEWWNWEKTGDTKGSQAATYWRQIINEHLIIQDCDELEFIGCNMGQFRLRKCYDEEGEYYEWTINDGCTWNRAESCEDGTPSEPPVPTDPVDDGGTYPDPDASGDRCKIVAVTFKRVFDDSLVFFSSVVNITPASRPYQLQQFLDARDDVGNGLQWYDAFSSFMNKYLDLDIVTSIENVIESAIWSDQGIDCIVSECYPLLADIDRAVMTCIADGIDEHADTLPSPSQDDMKVMLAFIADMYRIYPLSIMRANAFRDSINPEIVDGCPDCDEPEPGTCLPRFLDFETAPVYLTLTTGAIESGFARSGANCLKAVNMGAINGAGNASYVMDFAVMMEDVCEIDRVRLYIKLNNSNPDSNANAVQSIPFRILIYNGASLVFTKEYTYRPYYYTVSSKWNGLNILMDSPLAVGDKVQIYTYFNTRIAGRIINYRMDDVTVNVVTG